MRSQACQTYVAVTCEMATKICFTVPDVVRLLHLTRRQESGGSS